MACKFVDLRIIRAQGYILLQIHKCLVAVPFNLLALGSEQVIGGLFAIQGDGYAGLTDCLLIVLAAGEDQPSKVK